MSNSDDTLGDDLAAAAQQCLDVTFRYLRWAQESAKVAPDSEIEADDRSFSVMSMRELVDGQIKAALDCLLLATWSIVQGGGAVRGHGHPALVRSAITASTCAAWILDDDQDERRLRALQIAYAQTSAEALHVRDAPPGFRGPSVEGITELIASRNARPKKVTQDGASLDLDVAAIPRKPADQKIIRHGGDRIPPGWLPGDDPGAYVLAQWRILSGRAHGFSWPVKYAADSVATVDDPSFVTFNIGLSLDAPIRWGLECVVTPKCPVIVEESDLSRTRFVHNEGHLVDATISHPAGVSGGLR